MRLYKKSRILSINVICVYTNYIESFNRTIKIWNNEIISNINLRIIIICFTFADTCNKFSKSFYEIFWTIFRKRTSIFINIKSEIYSKISIGSSFSIDRTFDISMKYITTFTNNISPINKFSDLTFKICNLFHDEIIICFDFKFTFISYTIRDNYDIDFRNINRMINIFLFFNIPVCDFTDIYTR